MKWKIVGQDMRRPLVRLALMVFCASLPVLEIRGADAAEAANARSWQVAGAAYSGRSTDISEHTADARALAFQPDGSRMYVVGRGTRNVVEYTLAKPWEVDSAEYARELQLAATAAHGLFLHPETGADMYVLNRSEILQYELAIPWEVDSATLRKRKPLHCENASLVRGHDIHFAPDGTRFYVEDRINQEVYQYRLSTPWDVATLAWENTLDISREQRAVRGIELHPEGSRMWLLDTARREILEYDLSEPWQVASASLEPTFDVSAQAINPRGLAWRCDGRAFYITCNSRQRIFQYMIVPE